MSISRKLLALVVLGSALTGCYGSDEAGDGEGDPYSATLIAGLTVSGHHCPQSGEIAGRNVPSDNMYYLTSFGGGADNQRMACGGYADARWLYIADSWRFGCGSKVRLTNPRTGHWCVTQVADVGPNICVEQAAGRPIIDASPAATRELFNVGSAGWSDRISVRAERVASSTALGCGSGAASPTPPSTPGPTGGHTCFSSTWSRDMALGACVQSRSDNQWYQCTNIGWTPNSSIPSTHRGAAGACTTVLPLHS